MANETAETNQGTVFSQNRGGRQATPMNLSDPRGGATTKTPTQATQPSQVPEDSLESKATPKADPKKEVDWQKRHADLRAHADKKEKELGGQLTETLTTLADVQAELESMKTAQAKQSMLTDEQLTALSQEYPEFDKLAVTRGQQAAQDEVKALKAEINALKTQVVSTQVDRERNALLELHPDVPQIESSSEFREWFGNQPAGVQNLFTNDVTADIARGLDIYKSEAGLDSKAKKAKKLEETMAVKTDEPPLNPTGSKEKIWTRSEIKAVGQNPNAKDFAEKMAEINQAAREGRVVQD